MPRCPSGSRRCPPKVGKCHKSAAKRSVKRKPKHNRSVKRIPKHKVSSVTPTKNVPHQQTMAWKDHLIMSSSRFNITYGEAMTDKRSKNLWKFGHE